MDSFSLELENKDQKELRKQLLQAANKDCEEIQVELCDWKHKKSMESGSSRKKLIYSEDFDEKVAEIQERLKKRKNHGKAQEISNKTLQNVDIEATLQSSMLNQEILIRQYQLLVEKNAQEVNTLNEKISILNLELAAAKEKYTREYEIRILQLSNDLTAANEQSRYQEQRRSEKEAETESFRSQIQDRDRIITLLEQRVQSLENNLGYFKEKEFDYNNSKHFLDKEKKRRKIAEAEYKSLLEEVRELNITACDQLRKEYEEEIHKYQEIIKKYEINQHKSNSGSNQGLESMLNQQHSGRGEKIDEMQNHIEYLENICRDMTGDLKIWKFKATELVNKFFPYVISMREQLNKLKKDSITKQDKIKKLFEKTITVLSQKYSQALESSDEALKYFKSKAESLENQKSSRVKTCKYK